MYDRSGEGDFVEKRYVVNLDKDVESSFWLEDSRGDWVKRDGIYYYSPLGDDYV
jgi:hypothetical protein